MNITSIKYELQHILQGKSQVSYGESIQAIAGFLRESHSASTTAQRNEPNKPEETKRLIHYISTYKLFHPTGMKYEN